MCRVNPLAGAAVSLLLAMGLPTGASCQTIDFETLPGGAPTLDQQEISTEYAVYGVTFTLLDRTTGLPIGFPRIAKAGPPLTAFEGCFEVDTPRPHLDLGASFLTDGTELGVEGDLRIEYATPVPRASGVILDIDCRISGGPPCEQWTVTAYDTLGAVVEVVVLDAPAGAPNPECAQPEAGPGDAMAFGWVVGDDDVGIGSIVLSYTGAATGVGLAFDSFSVAGEPAPPAVAASVPADTVCAGERVELAMLVSGGLPPYTQQWQQEAGPGTWIDLGTEVGQEVTPVATTSYRVIVTDALASSATSEPVEIVVLPDDPLCTAGLLVSSHLNDRVIRYSFRSRLPQVFVPGGSGGLDGPSKLICGPDGNLYVTSQVNDRVLRFDGATGEFMDTFVADGSGGLDIPVGLAFGPDGNLYVASYQTHEVLRYGGADGAFIDAFVPYGSGLNGPTGLVFGPDGDLYVCSFLGDKVLRFDGETAAPLGDFVTVRSGGLDAPRGLVFGPDGNLYVSEQYNDSVRRYDGTTGAFIDVFVPGGSGGLDRANDLVFGLDGMLYVAGYDNGSVLRYDGASGAFLDELPPDFLNGPNWVSVGCQAIPTAVPGPAPRRLDLQVEPAAPNPFNPRTTVVFTLAAPGHTTVRVLDVAGRVVATLLEADLPSGRHAVGWDGRTGAGPGAPSGIYFVSVRSGAARESAKVLLLR